MSTPVFRPLRHFAPLPAQAAGQLLGQIAACCVTVDCEYDLHHQHRCQALALARATSLSVRASASAKLPAEASRSTARLKYAEWVRFVYDMRYTACSISQDNTIPHDVHTSASHKYVSIEL